MLSWPVEESSLKISSPDCSHEIIKFSACAPLCCKNMCCASCFFAWVVGELRAADPSNVQGPVKQNASPGEQSEAPRPGGSRGSSRTQDQKTRTVSTCWSNPGVFHCNFESFLPGRNYIRPPPPPISGQKAFSGGGGWGVYILRPHAAGIYTPPFYTPPTPRRVFSLGVLRSKDFFDPIFVVFRDFCKSYFWHPCFYGVSGYFWWFWFRWFSIISVILVIFFAQRERREKKKDR